MAIEIFANYVIRCMQAYYDTTQRGVKKMTRDDEWKAVKEAFEDQAKVDYEWGQSPTGMNKPSHYVRIERAAGPSGGGKAPKGRKA